jgi:cytochrome b6-f complex iron-sulfur subunit
VKTTRRGLLRLLGKGSVFLAFLVQVAAAARAFVPNVLYEPSQGITLVPEHRLFVIRRENDFHVISAVCTHLGCTVQWKPESHGFDCPCHGSRFHEDGVAYAGPAPRPLPWYAVTLAPDGSLEVNTAEEVARGYRFTPPKAQA